MKSRTTIQRHLKQLRTECIDTPEADAVLMRIAYAMETAVRWATENTVGWSGLRDEARMLADLLRNELRATRPTGETHGE